MDKTMYYTLYLIVKNKALGLKGKFSTLYTYSFVKTLTAQYIVYIVSSQSFPSLFI